MPHQIIKQLRISKNYSQKYMAQKLKMSDSNYSRIENSKVILNAEKLEDIAAALNLIRFELIYKNKEDLNADIKAYIRREALCFD